MAVVIGEIHSGILRNSAPVTSEIATEILAGITDYPVRSWERPIHYAISGLVLTGVDCDLPSSAVARRVVGTVATAVGMVGGRLLQTSSQARVQSAGQSRRLPWSHYLARPGEMEVFGKLSATEAASGFLSTTPQGRTLDLGGVCTALMGRAQRSALLDRPVPFRAERTRLRWAALGGPEESRPTAAFTIESDGLRTLSLTVPVNVLDRLPLLCQNLALHDWLLSTVNAMVESAGIGERPRESVVRRLRPAIDHLIHLWMPTARLPDDLLPYWHEIDRRSSLSVHWDALVQRVRDQLALALFERIDPRPVGEVDVREPRSVRP